MQVLIEKAEAGVHLSRQEAEAAMEEILSGRAGEDSIVALLAALRAKGETVEELVGFARAMRRHATQVFPGASRPDELLVDTCGTGGDASGTFNISTTAAFVVAGAGVRVGDVRDIETNAYGRIVRVSVGIGDGRAAWIDAADLRFDPATRVVVTDLRRADVDRMAHIRF